VTRSHSSVDLIGIELFLRWSFQKNVGESEKTLCWVEPSRKGVGGVES
jgi:hypothetical protein